MEHTSNGWRIVDRKAAVLTYTYVFDGKHATANSFVARLPNQTLLIVSPPCGVEAGVYDDLLAFGEVGAIVANNGLHYLGVAAWKARFPQARVFAPSDAMRRIASKIPNTPRLEPLSALQPLLGDDVGVHEAPPSKCGECWAWAKIDGGYAWFASDLLANMSQLPRNFFFKRMFTWTGSAPGFRPFHLAMKFTLRDKRATLHALAADLAAHPPTAMIPGHGDVLTQATLAADTQAVVASALR